VKRLLLPLFAGLAHALLLVLAFPPFGLWLAALVAIAPLVWIAVRPGRIGWREGVAIALGASAFYWYQCQWAIAISTAGYIPLVLYLTIYPGLVSLTLNFLHQRLPRVPLSLLVPIAWHARVLRLTTRPGVIVATEAHFTDENGRAAGGEAIPEAAAVEVGERRGGIVHVRWGADEGWLPATSVRVLP